MSGPLVAPILGLLGLAGCRPAGEATTTMCAPDDWCHVRRSMTHVCALRGDGRPQCWGWNMGAESYEEIEEWMDYYDCSDCVDWGQVSLMPDGPFVQVEFTTGEATVCGLTIEGAVECWGKSREILSNQSSTPFQTIALGVDKVCGITLRGNVECWGDDVLEWDETPPLALGAKVEAVTVKSWHGCALMANGSVECWGREGLGPKSQDFGQVSDTPSGRGYKALASTDYANCALSESNTWTCWGERSWCGGADGVGGPVDPTFCYWDMVDPLAPGGYTYDPDNDPIAWGLGTLTAPWMSSFDMDPPGCGLAADGRLLCGSAEIFRGVPQAPSWLRFLEVDIKFGGCGVTTNHDLVCWGGPTGSDFDGEGEVVATYTDDDGDEQPYVWRLTP